ncbi:DUF742 domain-containing protein [Streptomyces sp. NBC_01497]|uniref:DUF742 domain-containing protein n=1 Tax=Streptomyces sp. NBC_01497 TaxID=2903885 RepID=UPI002E359574|nr:DUF742 domain-containing protein [Streptomyces sp. NBC_01497]
MSGPGRGWEEESPERLYIITGGRSGSTGQKPLDLVTLIVARSGPTPGMSPEQSVILRLCQSPLSVAEISSYTALPMSAVTVLLGDLLAEEHVLARPPIPQVKLPDPALIKAVIDGLQKL